MKYSSAVPKDLFQYLLSERRHINFIHVHFAVGDIVVINHKRCNGDVDSNKYSKYNTLDTANSWRIMQHIS